MLTRLLRSYISIFDGSAMRIVMNFFCTWSNPESVQCSFCCWWIFS